MSNLAAQKNGYLLVYVSNESNFTVFFDNFQVVHKPGSIIEENHYYPFGLVMNGISSKGLNDVAENKKKYNGIEQNSDFDLNMYDAYFRNLDPQIGRWWQIDPKIDGQEIWSPYNAMTDNPILKSDPLGDTSILQNQIKNIKDGWNDFKQGKGTAYEALDFFNRTFNPLTDVYHSLTGNDYVTGEKVSRAEGLLGLGLMVIGGKAEMAAAKTIGSQALEGGVKAAKTSTLGGLNLFKWGAPQTTKTTGWKAGDYMLHLPNKGTPALNWKANYGALRREMGLGQPIYDSYRMPNGKLMPTGGFLNAERSILQGRGWIYNPNRGAWIPRGF